MLEAVILAGGRGERFWPLSRRSHPKQMLHLFGERSLLQLTWDRLRTRLAPEAIRIVAGADLEAAIAKELPELTPGNFVPEPVGRNTAPAVAVAAALARRDGDPLQLVVPSDHWIPDAGDFWQCVDEAAAVAAAPDAPLVTLAVPITRPETGYGYIERGAVRAESARAFTVARFHEKPTAAQAAHYQAAGCFYWNSGIFLWRASALLAEVALHLPVLHQLVDALRTVEDPATRLPAVFAGAASESIDYGVMEKSARVALVEARFQWSDLGTWDSWGELVGSDARGNAVQGLATLLESENCLVVADDGLVATFGVKNLVVVRAGDVTLVLDRARCQEVRQILEALRKRADGARFL